ncbi:MAG: anti-sigma factor [Candidatus Acidiferrales bacterium]|jgi:anti-sigma-K factor RskA
MNGHPNREELFDLYALGVLEGDELAAIESHVATCDDCAQKLAEARGRISLLAFAAPLAQPSPGVKEKLLRQVSASAGERIPGRAPEAAPDRKSSRPAPERTGLRANWWSAIFAPAAAALALATILLWVSNNHLNNEIARQQADLQQLKQQTEQVNALLDLASAHDTISVSLAPSPEMKGATAHVLYNARMGKMFYSDTLSAAPPGKSFQLWLVPPKGDPISAGVLAPQPGVGSRLVATMPPGIAAKAFAVTLEPAGGVPKATGPAILVGPVS